VVFHIEQSGYGNLLGSGIVITGGGALLRHLAQLISYKTGQSVRIGYPGQFLASDADKVNEPLFATAVGLLMQGLRYMDDHPATRSHAPHDIRQTPRPAPAPTPAPAPAPVTETFFQPTERSNDYIDNGFGDTDTSRGVSGRQEKSPDEKTKDSKLGSFFSRISAIFEEKEDDENDRM
jgi:cell division protein FtsA